MSRIDDLRKEYRIRRAAATRKIADNRRKGVDLAGSKYDPRLDRGAEKIMNSRQLQSAINRLNRFTDRKSQFVSLQDNIIIPRATWMKYKRPEQAVARIARAERQRMATLKLPDGTTVAEQQTMLHNVMGGDQASHKPFTERNRRPTGVKSLRAIRELIARENAKLNPNYKAKNIKSARKSADKMMRMMGNHADAERIASLDDERFYIAWNYGGLAQESAVKYVTEFNDNVDPSEGFAEMQDSRISEIIDWAEQIDLEQYGNAAPIPKAKAKRKR